MKVLAINSGSSSIKYQLFSMPDNKVLAKSDFSGENFLVKTFLKELTEICRK